jgi:VanZ like protein
VLIGRLLLAIAVAAGVIFSAPFIRDIRVFIRTTFPGHYVTVVAGGIAIIIGVAVLVALIRIRNRRAFRYGMIAAALVLGAAYARWNAQGDPAVDAVERFHFVEYGLIALLFYRAFRPAADLSTFALPIVAGIIVGTCEEWLQWFIPGRVGDMRDVFLNLAAIVCGLLFSVGADPADRLSWSMAPASRRRVAVVSAAAVIVFAAFVHSVHLGREIDDPDAGRFRSRYDGATLLALSSERSATWRTDPPVTVPVGFRREDQYFSEGVLHVTARNLRWRDGDYAGSWFENRILEKYYAPLLDTPSYIEKKGFRWPEAQRADAEQRYRAAGAPAPSTFLSAADVAEGKHFIRLWPATRLWGAAALFVIALLAFGLRRSRM